MYRCVFNDNLYESLCNLPTSPQRHIAAVVHGVPLLTDKIKCMLAVADIYVLYCICLQNTNKLQIKFVKFLTHI